MKYKNGLKKLKNHKPNGSGRIKAIISIGKAETYQGDLFDFSKLAKDKSIKKLFKEREWLEDKNQTEKSGHQADAHKFDNVARIKNLIQTKDLFKIKGKNGGVK